MVESTPSKWLAGVVGPLLLLIPASNGLLTGQTFFASMNRGGGDSPLFLTGTAGRLLALTYISFAATLHLHCFLEAKYPDAAWPARAGNVFALLSVCGLGCSFFRLFDMLAI
ncbi:MAG: hypothetical protein JWL81_1178 [Verrucomicrobiales bacterium]|nr:hypothetical protein [Verrucomicrobiales bacterium]